MSCIVVARGGDIEDIEGSHVGAITEDLGIIQLPILPIEKIRASSMVLHDGAILLCGGTRNRQKCLQLDHGTWKEHSTLNQERYGHSAVTTQTATFLFGGENSRKTYEYLPKGSTTWLIGKTEIPGGFDNGCAIAVKSDQEIWLIGGSATTKRILSFNVNDHTFKELPSQFELNKGRFGHKCAFIPNTKKVMITGGCGLSTEVLDTEDGSVTMASPMNYRRSFHGMGVLTIKGEDRLTVFGGLDGNKLDSVETYNSRTGKWETLDIKLNKPKESFGFLHVKLSDILSELQCIKLFVNFNNLPPEMVERILKILPFKEICQARRICKRWKEIIDKGKLVKDAAGNDLSHLPYRPGHLK